MKSDIFLNYNKILSYMFLLCFVMGDRGNGKTYGFKKWAINDYLKTGKEFIYLRRYKSELKDCNKFFRDIQDKYPDWEFSYNGGTFFIKPAHDEKAKNKPIGYAVALSTALTKKSVAYPLVNKICFDEFVIMKSHLHYLPGEVNMMLEFYETVARMRDDVRMIFLANRISEINPYFLYFNIRLKKCEFDYDRKRNILIVQSNNQNYRKQKSNTRFGKLIENTDYGGYAFGGEYLNDNDSLIAIRTPQSILKLVIKFQNKVIGLWVDYDELSYYFSYKARGCEIKIAIKREEMDDDFGYVGKSGWAVQFLRRVFKSNSCYYENQEIKSLMFDVMKEVAF